MHNITLLFTILVLLQPRTVLALQLELVARTISADAVSVSEVLQKIFMLTMLTTNTFSNVNALAHIESIKV